MIEAMPKRRTRVLVLIEPASYTLDFLHYIHAAERDDVQVFFASANRTQTWAAAEDARRLYRFLPSGRIASAIELFRALWRSDVSLLHTAGWYGWPVLLSWCVARLRGVPIFVEYDTGIHPGRPAHSSWLRRVVYPLLFRMPFRFLPAGQRQRAFVRAFGVPDARITIHQMSVDVARIQRGISGSGVQRGADDAVRFLFVGRLEPGKGLHILLAAYRRCVEQGLHVALSIVGSGSLANEVARDAHGLTSVTTHGRLEGQGLLDAYAAADVFVFPSFVENWGLVVNEAMAAGLPVIATHSVGCVDDLVHHEDNGLLVDADDTDALAAAMTRLATNAAERKAMAESSRRRIATWTMADQARIIEKAWADVGLPTEAIYRNTR